jgi:hypothetical protein
VVTPIIIGDRTDGHVSAVIALLTKRNRATPIVLDAPGLQQSGFSVDLQSISHRGQRVDLHDGGRGWLRRYAPSAWGTGSVAGSVEAVTKRAFLSLVGSITRLGDRDWLTPLDSLLAGEDRLVQLEAAQRAGVRVPMTLVTSDSAEAADRLGDRFVVKPLAGGYFWTEEGPRAVFATELGTEEAVGLDFAAAPFIAQERLRAREHLRVVTVLDDAWVAALSTQDRPLDWRQQEAAHFEWSASTDAEAGANALRVAESLRVRYSSQDWVRDDDGLAFLDLNPGGQWMFLPDSISRPVCHSIARFLEGGPT